MARARLPLLTLISLGILVLAPFGARAPDATPPWATGWGPTGTSVPVDSHIAVGWSEAMDWASVEVSFMYTDGVLVYTQGAWAHDAGRNTSQFQPAALLQPATRYTVRFDTTAKDVSGNRLDQNRNGIGGESCEVGPPGAGDCLVWSFTTASLPPDTAPPRVVWTTPPSGGLATTNAPIEVRFSEAMDTAAVEQSFSYGDGYSLYTIEHGTVSWLGMSSPDDTLRLDPFLEFASGGQITVNLRGGTARDLAGNPLDGNGDGAGGDDYSWSFRVVSDPAPPRVLDTHPGPGSASNSISTAVRVSFSKAMNRDQVELSLSLAAPGAPTLTSANGSSTWTGTRFPDDTLSFNPYPNLRTAAAYTLRLASDDARDRQGLGLDGGGNGTWEGSPADDFLLRFTTEPEDRTSPWIASRVPGADATGVAPSTILGAVFSESMNRSSVEASFSYTDGNSAFSVENGTVSWNAALDEFAFRPARALTLGARYTVTINGTAADEAGNPLDGVSEGTWSFTVAAQPDTTPPWVRSTSPFNGQRNVSRTARISLIFSEPMDKAAVEAAMGITAGASLREFRWPNDETVEVATALPMEYRSPYVVFVLTGATDVAGNSLTQPFQIGFMTGPWRGSVTGRAADEGGAGIAGVRVQLNGLSVVTNASGGFVFKTVEQGTYTLTVAHPGYEPFTESVKIDPEPGPLATITLRRASMTAVDAALWAGAGAVLLAVVLLVVWLRRRKSRPTEHYETWKPAKVVVMEPGHAPPKDRP